MGTESFLRILLSEATTAVKSWWNFLETFVISEQVLIQQMICIYHSWLWQAQILYEEKIGKHIFSASLHFCLHLNVHIHLWTAWKPSKIISLGNCDSALIYVNFTSYNSKYQDQWKKLLDPWLYPDCIISPHSPSNSQLNWILNREQPHYLLRVRKRHHVNGNLLLSCSVTLDDKYLSSTHSNCYFKDFSTKFDPMAAGILYFIINNCQMLNISSFHNCIKVFPQLPTSVFIDHIQFFKDLWKECTTCTTFL